MLYCYFHESGILEYFLVFVIYRKLQIPIIFITAEIFIFDLVKK
jgi:hypothetical protein